MYSRVSYKNTVEHIFTARLINFSQNSTHACFWCSRSRSLKTLSIFVERDSNRRLLSPAKVDVGQRVEAVGLEQPLHPTDGQLGIVGRDHLSRIPVPDAEQGLAELVMVIAVGEERGGWQRAVIPVSLLPEGVDGGKLFTLQLDELLGPEIISQHGLMFMSLTNHISKSFKQVHYCGVRSFPNLFELVAASASKLSY